MRINTCVYIISHIITVNPLNKGHVRDNINSHAFSLVDRLSSSRRFKLYCYYRETKFSGPRTVHCREVFNTVSLSRRIHYQRFHCIYIIIMLCMCTCNTYKISTFGGFHGHSRIRMT